MRAKPPCVHGSIEYCPRCYADERALAYIAQLEDMVDLYAGVFEADGDKATAEVMRANLRDMKSRSFLAQRQGEAP